VAKDEAQLKVDKNLEKIKNRLLVFSGKGGVGKSTVAANLSLAFARKGLKVGLLDVDIHGPNLAKMLGVEGKRLDVSADGIRAVDVNNNLKLVSMSFLLQDPNIPVIWRGPMKMKAIEQLQFGWKLNLKIFGIIENMSGMICPHCGKKIDIFKEGGGERAAKEMQVPFLGRIPLDPQIVALGDEGKSFIEALPEASASKAFMEVAERILESA
jgi:Mrp family chromosome partitioning ATPase